MTEQDNLFAEPDGEGHDADEVEALLAAFEDLRTGLLTVQADLAGRLAALDTSMGKAVGGVRSAIEAEYAGEMTRLCDLVRSLESRLVQLEKQLDKDGQLVARLNAGMSEAQQAANTSSRAMQDANTLVHKLDGLIKRRDIYYDQNRAQAFWAGIGGLTGVLLVLIFFWMLPQGPETWAARTIMGEKSYWSSAWRMLDRWSSTDADKLRALSWVEGRNGHLEHLQSCRQKALDTGRFQWCQVVFFPKDARDMTPPPPP